MCDPVTLGIATAMSVGGKLISDSDATSNANRQAAARNAVLKQTLDKENGFADANRTEQNANLAHYAPGAQGQQLSDAQGSRAATATGNITQSDPNAVPITITSDAPPAVRGEIAKRMLAVHDGAVNRAKLSANLGGYGDTWLTNSLHTADADRNIGVNNNFANGQKDILSSLQDSAGAAAYKAPSIWGPALSTGGSLVAGAAGAGKGIGGLFPKTAAAPSFFAPSDL